MSSIDIQKAYTIHRVPPFSQDVDAAKHITDLFASSGDYTMVLLQPGASYNLYSRIFMRGNHQELATERYPTEQAQQAKLYTRGEHESGAIDGVNKENIVIRCLHIIGLREQMGWLKEGAALIIIGGWDAKEPILERCHLVDPRGWSSCHLVDGSQGGRIVNNFVGPCGNPAPDGPWADGLSIACRNGLIANNTIIDATDGAIVVFCAPGTTVVGNTIIARSRNLMGGINLVDPFPFDANFTGTKVISNHIMTDGAFIHMAIGIGSTTWSDAHDIQNYGGTVADNLIGPGRFGYGVAAAGCKDFTVLGNRISQDTRFTGSMDIIPEVSPPSPFLRINDGWAEGTFQSDFIEGPVRFLIGVRDGAGSGMQYHADNLKWTAGSEASLQKARIELLPEGELVVWDQQHAGRVLWTSGSSSSGSGGGRRRNDVEPALMLDRQTGQLTLRNTRPGQTEAILWNPMRYLEDISYKCWSKDPVLLLADSPPYLQVRDAGSTLYTSHAEWKHWDLIAGSFITVVASNDEGSQEQQSIPPPVPHDSRPTSLSDALSSLHFHHHQQQQPTCPAPPPPLPARDGSHRKPAKNTYLWMDPSNSRLVLHTSKHPEHPEEAEVLWTSPNWKHCQSIPQDPSKATLQGDGNLVVYGSGQGAIWASGTNDPDMNIDSIAIAVDSKGPRLELRSQGQPKWSSARR